MSQSASQAATFFKNVTRTSRPWTVRAGVGMGGSEAAGGYG